MKKGTKQRIEWDAFTQINPEFAPSLVNQTDIWFEKFNEFKKYINDNNDNNITKLFGSWLNHTKKRMKYNIGYMKIGTEQRKVWDEFITNNPKYAPTFETLDEKWINKLNELIKYMKINKGELPNRNNNSTLVKWISDTKVNYKEKIGLMKIGTNRYNIWTKFIVDNPIFAIEDKPIEKTQKQIKQCESTKKYRDKKKEMINSI